jgi:hypothetical protein
MDQIAFNFEQPALPYKGAELTIAQLILDATSTEPASIHWLQRKAAQEGAEISDRRIKQIVEELRDSGHIVCASREKPYGYYLPKDADELKAGLSAYLSQSISQIKKIRKLCASSAYKEIFGQVRLQVETALNEEL